MNFDEFDQKMRVWEREADFSVPAAPFLVARLDGRSFTRLTKTRDDFEKPFDARVRDAMAATLLHLCDCGFAVRYGFCQSDEISLLFEPNGQPFKNARKWLSVLAGEASAKFSLGFGEHGVFDCRFCVLPDQSRALDYFRWRQEDGARNALSAHCYWRARKNGATARAATKTLEGQSSSQKRAFLSQNGVDFEEFPTWQRRGFAVRWEIFQKTAFDPRANCEVVASRRRLKTEWELPGGEDYARFLSEIFADLGL